MNGDCIPGVGNGRIGSFRFKFSGLEKVFSTGAIMGTDWLSIIDFLGICIELFILFGLGAIDVILSNFSILPFLPSV